MADEAFCFSSSVQFSTTVISDYACSPVFKWLGMRSSPRSRPIILTCALISALWPLTACSPLTKGLSSALDRRTELELLKMARAQREVRYPPTGIHLFHKQRRFSRICAIFPEQKTRCNSLCVLVLLWTLLALLSKCQRTNSVVLFPILP